MQMYTLSEEVSPKSRSSVDYEICGGIFSVVDLLGDIAKCLRLMDVAFHGGVHVCSTTSRLMRTCSSSCGLVDTPSDFIPEPMLAVGLSQPLITRLTLNRYTIVH